MQTVTRLLNTFSPEHYTLTLDLQRIQRRFKGRVAIKGRLNQASEKIALHTKELTIASASIDGVQATSTLGDNDETSFSSGAELSEGEHVIEVTFEGTITDGMHGLYPCYYEHNGVKKELLATQFESHHAREVFPCVDEPAAKATFDVTLNTETGITVLGNMPVKEQREQDDKLHTTFETSPRMSTYLVAFVTGELQKATARSKSGVEVNIWATPAQPAESLIFPLDVATRAIDFFSDYFGTPYPLPKADHVALPDFSSGAMENWGLITYRETCLLVDPLRTSTSVKQYAAIVICHELSHQWFGNLVTMKWWDDLWLNESFASIMEYVAVDNLFPEWQIWLTFTTSEVLSALRRDSLPGVQAVRTDVHHPDEISSLFDPSIVYAKGARLLRMLRSYVGDDAFKRGLSEYFKVHKYGNTAGSDLWKSLSEASGKDVATFMDIWLDQSGFPVVSASLDDTTVTLTQKQFITGVKPTDSKLWPVLLAANQSEVPEMFTTETVAFAIDIDDFFKLNESDVAHYVTHYDAQLLEKIVTAIKDDKLEPVDRLQVLHEASFMPRAGVGSSADTIPLLEAYRRETAEPVWDIISVAVGDLRKFVENDEESEQQLKLLVRSLAAPMFEKLGWDSVDGEPESDSLLRVTTAGMMLYSEDSVVIKEALQRYKAAKNTIDTLPSDLRSLILTAAVRFSDNKDEVTSSLIHIHRTTSSGDIRQDIADALTSTRDIKTIEELLSLLKDTTFVRPQDTARWYAYLLRNRYAREAAWAWVRNNWQWIQETFSGDKSYDTFARYAGAMLVTRNQLEEYKQFFLPMKNEPALTRAIEIGISDIEARVEWIERDANAVRTKLLERKK